MSGIQPLRRASLTNQSQVRDQVGQKQMLRNVLQNTLGKRLEQKPAKDEPKKRNIFHGKANPTESENETTEENNLAADVELVAFGVNKEAKPEDLKKFLIDKGIKVTEVKCLTRIELLTEDKVRSKTMKVTVKAAEHEKAMNPDLWPLRVGVRYYRAQSRRQTPGEGGDQGAEAGGLQDRRLGQGGVRRRQGGNNFRGQKQQPPPGSREWNQNRRNRYEEVDGWNVPRNAPITIENLQEVLSEIMSHP